MKVLVIILILIALWLIFGPMIKAWLRRRAEEKLADFLRAQMGIPTEKEQRKARKAAEKEQRRNGSRTGYWSRPEPRRPRHSASEPIIPKEYATDVEFTEIREFRQTTIVETSASSSSSSSGSFSRRRGKADEGQVSDVEYTDL